MPEVWRETRAAAAALTLLVLLAFAHAALIANAAQLPERILGLEALVSLALLQGDVRRASSYSLLLCQAIAETPPGILASSPDEAARLAYLASIREYAPGYIDYIVYETVYSHLTGSMKGGVICSTSSVPQQPIVAQPGEATLPQLAESGESYESAYSQATKLIEESVKLTSGGLNAATLTRGNETTSTQFAKLLQELNTTAAGASGFNLTSILEGLAEGLKGVNISVTNVGGSSGPASLEHILNLNLSSIGGSRVNLPSLELSGASGGTYSLPSLPSPSLPSFTVPVATLPPLNLQAALAAAALAAVALLAWRGRDVARLLERRVLEARIREAAERGDVDALIDAFARLLELIGRECRPRHPSETHREYSRVLRGDAIREYLRAALAYEQVKFGGRLSKAEAVRVVREAAERLASRLECSEEGGGEWTT